MLDFEPPTKSGYKTTINPKQKCERRNLKRKVPYLTGELLLYLAMGWAAVLAWDTLGYCCQVIYGTLISSTGIL